MLIYFTQVQMCCVIRLEESQGKGQQFVHANELQQVLGSYKVRSSGHHQLLAVWWYCTMWVSHQVCKPAYLVPVPSQDKLRGLGQEEHLA